MDTTNDIERHYSECISLEHRKRHAQFFTPTRIARIMSDWLLGNERLSDVLEPAFGLGIFSRILLSEKPQIRITGFETDDIIGDQARTVFKGNPALHFSLQDYIYSEWNTRYDGIICNPPYFKFHDYDNRTAVPEVNKHLNLRLNLQTNLYALFLLKSVSQLKEGGRCAYIVPSEFMNADYGVLIKRHLINSGKLRHIIIFDFNENIFDDALTTSAIILCANDNHDGEIAFTYIRDAAGLDKAEQIIASYPDNRTADYVYDIKNIQAETKWRNYYHPLTLPEFKNLTPFSTYAKVMRGIATGANDYFSFSLPKMQRFGIIRDNLQPCICHSTDITGLCFTENDFRRLQESGKDVYIFNPQNLQDKETMTYIKLGETEKINERFLTSKRKPWYAMEKRPPSPIWAGVFNRNGLKFIRNETTTVNLTTFHCVYVNHNLFGVDADLLFAYLISDTAKILFSTSGREYGNGLNKFEPNDLNKSHMLDIGSLEEHSKNEIRNIYLSNKHNNDLSFIEEIDQLLINSFS